MLVETRRGSARCACAARALGISHIPGVSWRITDSSTQRKRSRNGAAVPACHLRVFVRGCYWPGSRCGGSAVSCIRLGSEFPKRAMGVAETMPALHLSCPFDRNVVHPRGGRVRGLVRGAVKTWQSPLQFWKSGCRFLERLAAKQGHVNGVT